MKNRTLNEYRQTKDSVYKNNDSIVERDINLLCSCLLYTSDAADE